MIDTGIKIKRFLFISLLLTLPIFSIGSLIYYDQFSDTKAIFEIQVVERLKGQAEIITDEFTHIASDLLFLAEQNELQAFLNHGDSLQKKAIAREYLTFSTRKQLYDQIRFLDETGMEIVRVNFNAGMPTIVASAQLQNKGKRYYFEDTFELERQEVFVSPLDLNIEHGEIEQPLKPMMRFGTPVFDEIGNKRGIILLNFLGAKLLTRLARQTSAPDDIMLLNAEGFWLKGKVPADEWGFMYPDSDKSFGKRFPLEWQQILQAQSGQFYTDNGLFAFITIYPLLEGQKSSTGAQPAFSPSVASLSHQDYFWKMVSHVPKLTLQQESIRILNNMLIPMIMLVLLAIIVAMWLTQASIKRKEAEIALRASEERLKAIVAAIPIPMAITHFAKNTFLYINEHYRQHFNIQTDPIEQYQSQQFYQPSDWEKLVERLVEDNYVHNFELQTQSINGKRFWEMISLRLMTFNGEPAIISVIHDITERKQAEAEIQRQHKFLQTVINSLDHPFYVIDANTYQIIVANATAQALGMKERSACYASTHHKNEPCASAEHPCPLKLMKHTHQATVVEHIHFDSEDQPKIVEVRSFPLFDSAGQLTQMIEYSIDITERKAMEKALRESEIRYRQMFEQHPSIRLLIDPSSTQIVDANQAATDFYGYSLSELKQMNISDLSQQPLTEVVRKLNQAQQGQLDCLIVAHQLASGDIRQVEICPGPIEIKGCQLLYTVIFDVTERILAEEQLQKQYEELQAQNEQLEAFARQLEEMQQEKLYQLNQAYERFVPKEFISFLNKNSITDVQLGDHVAKEMVVLFADIRNFTAMSEAMTPADNFNFINVYLSYMEPVIHHCQGVIDKYIGDAIMALFPTADNALQAAIGMLRRLVQYNTTRGRPGRPLIRIGIGLNLGPLMLGIIGGNKRMDGTVVSDAVNLASRVEGLTKTYGVNLLITESTYAKLVEPSQYQIRVIDRVKVKGKSEAITVYEVYDADPASEISLKNQICYDFEKGFVWFHQGHIEIAKSCFERVLQVNAEDKAAQIYLRRCE